MPEPPSQSPPPRQWIWTRRQRRGLAILVLILCVGLAAIARRNPARVSDPPPDAGPRAGQLLTRLDPNTADLDALAALPAIGPKRAADIVALRNQRRTSHPNLTPFARLEDLLRVKGIGPATLETLEPYLVFPSQTTSDVKMGQGN